MTRVNGHAPLRDADTIPPHLPYVLLCHYCARRWWTVNTLDEWRVKLNSRQNHSNRCLLLGMGLND